MDSSPRTVTYLKLKPVGGPGGALLDVARRGFPIPPPASIPPASVCRSGLALLAVLADGTIGGPRAITGPGTIAPGTPAPSGLGMEPMGAPAPAAAAVEVRGVGDAAAAPAAAAAAAATAAEAEDLEGLDEEEDDDEEEEEGGGGGVFREEGEGRGLESVEGSSEIVGAAGAALLKAVLHASTVSLVPGGTARYKMAERERERAQMHRD
ncbi:unnamed protein product [Closterium sp. NIES-53]